MDSYTQENLKKKYNPERSTIRNLQYAMLSILKEFIVICERHNIPYWIEEGTLLGAVRHQGFIPWDDDLDIQVLKKTIRNYVKY